MYRPVCRNFLTDGAVHVYAAGSSATIGQARRKALSGHPKLRYFFRFRQK